MAEPRSGWFGDGWTRLVGWAGGPSFGRDGSSKGSVGALVVVERQPFVELVLEFGEGAGWALPGQPALGGLVGSFDLAAGLGMPGRRCDVPDPEGGEVPLELDLVAAEEPAGETGPVVRHDMGGQSPAAGGVAEGVPGGLAAGSAGHAGGEEDPGVVVDEVHDPHLFAAGQDPLGGVDLPGAVGRRPLETPPGRPGPFLRLRRHQTPPHQRPMNRRHRWDRPSGPGQVVGDRLRPIVQRELLPEPNDLILQPGRDHPRRPMRPPRPFRQPRRPLRFEPSPVLVERLPGDAHLGAQLADRHGLQASGEHRQQPRLHRRHLSSHANQQTRP